MAIQGDLPAAFVLAASLTMICAWGLIRAAPKLGLVDHPAGRKAHAAPTPAVGGIAIALALVALAVTARGRIAGIMGFEMSAVGFVLVGVVDDRIQLPAKLKFALQVALCASAVLTDNVALHSLGPFWPGGPQVELGLMGPVMTVLAAVTVVNAFNMIDGVDGLCGSLALVALATLGIAGLAGAAATSALALTALCGAITGFLAFNFPWRPATRARLFLGDAGSMLLGFCVAYFALRLCAEAAIHYSDALWIALIPVFDAVLVFARRALVSGRPFTAGRDHIHHLLMQAWTPRATTLGLFAAAAIVAPLGFLLHAIRPGLGFGAWVMIFCGYGLGTHRTWLSAWRRSHVVATPAHSEAAAQAAAASTGLDLTTARAVHAAVEQTKAA